MRRVLFAIVLTIALAVPAHAGFDEGLAAHKRGDYATALREWRPLAEQGNATAQSYLGAMFHYGLGVARDYAEAMKWYLKAAEQGNTAAQYSLGVMYDQRRGVPKNYAEAMKWYRKAAEQGNAAAQENLELMFAEQEDARRAEIEAQRREPDAWERHTRAGETAYRQGDYAEAEAQLKTALKAAEAERSRHSRLPVQAMPVTRASCEQGLVQEALTAIMESTPEGEKRRLLLEKLNDNGEMERVRSRVAPLRDVSTPQYQGLVTPIRQPIVLRIRPFPQSTLTMEQKMSSDGKSESLGAVWGGTVLAQPLDSSIEATMAIGNYESWKNDQQVSRELEKMQMNLLVSERGKLLDSSSGSFGSVSGKALKNICMGFEQIKELLKAIFPTLPKQSVVTGDKVWELNRSLVVPHSFVISMSMDAIVQGSTQYHGRPSLVVDLSGFAKILLSCIPMHGYGVLDIDTAILTHYDVIFGARLDDISAIWKYREVLQVDLNG